MKTAKLTQQRNIDVKLGVSINYIRWGKVKKNKNFTSPIGVL